MMLRYLFQFSKKAQDEFDRLDRVWQSRILKKIDFFEKQSNPLVNAKPLKGYPNYCRFRIGDYRIITSIERDGILVILLIVKVAHRREVYE